MVLKSCGHGSAKNSAGTFQQMVEPRTSEAGQARDADDRLGVGGDPAAGKIRAKNKKGANQPDRNHQAVRAERQMGQCE